MVRTVPCLWFDTEGEEAAEFYVSVFPNSRIQQVTHYGPGSPRPEGTVLTVAFSLDGQDYLALNGGPEFRFSEAVSFQVMCDSQEEVDHYWDALSVGGEEGNCGWLKDRFGLSWQIVPRILPEVLGGDDPASSERAMGAMLTMHKLDVAELRRAAEGSPS